jgi:hypothetical protein
LVSVWHGRVPKIVIAGAEKGPLRDTAMRTDQDGFEIQNPNFLPNPSVITNRQLPGEKDVDPRFDDNALPNLRPKEPQEGALERRWKRHRVQENYSFDQMPNRLDQQWSSPVQTVPSVEQVKPDSCRTQLLSGAFRGERGLRRRRILARRFSGR